VVLSFCEISQNCWTERVCRSWRAGSRASERTLEAILSSFLSVRDWDGPMRSRSSGVAPLHYLASHNCTIQDLRVEESACTDTLRAILRVCAVVRLDWAKIALPGFGVALCLSASRRPLEALRLPCGPDQHVLDEFLECCGFLDELEVACYGHMQAPAGAAGLVNQFFASERRVRVFAVATLPLWWREESERPPGDYGPVASNLRGAQACVLPHMLQRHFEALVSHNSSTIDKLVVHRANVHSLVKFPLLLGQVTTLGLMDVKLSCMLDVALVGLLRMCPNLRTLILRPCGEEEEEIRLSNTLRWCSDHRVYVNWSGIMGAYQLSVREAERGKDTRLQRLMHTRGLALA
jgi:hypothetical protein